MYAIVDNIGINHSDMAQKSKPIAVVKPMWRDPILTEMEQAIRAIAGLIYQRQEDQRQMEEYLQRWESRGRGHAMMPNLEALNKHIAEKLNELETRIQQLDPDYYSGYMSCHRQLTRMQRDAVGAANEVSWYPQSSGYGYSDV